MATTASDEPSVSAEKVLKRHKKQARREAKLMLAIKAAKKDLKKAQKQQSMAQARLEERSTTLHTLEARLEELRIQSPQAVTDETSQSTTDAEATSLPGEESTLPEGSMVIADATQVDTMQESEAAIVRAPASTTTRKTSARKTAAARTSTATKQSSNRSQVNRKPSSDAGQKE
ncbi:MAG TPA: hypothetical protein VIY29_22045 [Ktedonobacteraceae bacterium]